jgi:hypothetical protein
MDNNCVHCNTRANKHRLTQQQNTPCGGNKFTNKVAAQFQQSRKQAVSTCPSHNQHPESMHGGGVAWDSHQSLVVGVWHGAAAGRYILHQDSVASTSTRTGGMAPPTAAAAAAAHPVMGPPAHLEDLLPQAAPSMPPPWVPAAGPEAQEGLEQQQQQQQQLSDQEHSALGSLALLANAGECS